MTDGGAGAEATGTNVAGEGETDADARTLLDGLADRLVEFGMDRSAVEVRVESDGSPLDAIVEAAAEYDAVVMGESDPSLATFVFGMPAEQIADRFLGPVVVVQRERSENEPA